MKKAFTLILLGLSLNIITPLQASGTYQKPAAKADVDSAKYAMGQKTFEGKMVADGAGNAKAQKSKLAAIQAKIPSGAGDVTQLAGRITDQQVSALAYYVSIRFAKK
jgi:hypothetical protein